MPVISRILSGIRARIPLLRPKRRAYLTPAPDSTAARVNNLVELFDSPRYLEIGLLHGETFCGVSAVSKCGVDPLPRFRLSPGPLDYTISIYEMTSDAFFKKKNDPLIFDIVFIDGPHTFKQTWADFTNSVEFVDPLRHPAWIIDDVIPMNEFEAIPSYKDCKRAFKLAGQRPGQWRGDVWKILFALEACNGIDFVIFESQTLVWLKSDPGEILLPERRQLNQIQSLIFDAGLLDSHFASRSGSWETALNRYLISRRST